MHSHTIKDNTMSENIELFELELTKDQLHALSTLLPKGFSLELVPKSTTSHESGSRPSKKLFTNEGNQVVRKNSKAAEIPREDILINKQALRDPGKRKFPAHVDYKYSSNIEVTPSTSSKAVKINTETVRKCHILLQKLKRHPSASPFLHPVDVIGLGLVDYYQVVKEPMDISTVENKLKSTKYVTLDQFLADLRKVWNNAFLYNMKGSHIYVMTMEMSTYFEKLVRDFENVAVNDTVKDLEKRVEMLSKQVAQMSQKGSGRSSSLENSGLKLNRSGSKTNKNAKLMDKPLTVQETKAIVQNIQKLPAEHLRGVWEIVSKEMDLCGREELEFDIEALPIHVARELERFVKNKLSLINRGKNKGKVKDIAVASKEAQSTSYSALKHHEGEFEVEDELTTQHHSSIIGSVEKLEGKEVAKKAGSPSGSSESSFISDSDDDNEKVNDKMTAKGSSSLQKQQEIANFFAGGHGSMLNSFIVK